MIILREKESALCLMRHWCECVVEAAVFIYRRVTSFCLVFHTELECEREKARVAEVTPNLVITVSTFVCKNVMIGG